MQAFWLSLADFLFNHGLPTIGGFIAGYIGAWTYDKRNRAKKPANGER